MIKRSYGAMIVLLVFGGCKTAPVPAPVIEKGIVQKVEDGGIAEADLNRADAAGMQLWFGKHQEVAQSVASQCKAAMKDDLAWKTSVEGRICLGDKFDGYGMRH